MTQESKRPTDHEPVDVKDRQMPLYGRYGDAPGEATITDRAKTTGGTETDPFHGAIEPGSQDYGIAWEFGIHSAVGGFHDAPNPGDILCAALAACLDSTIRIVAGRIDVTLEHLAVEVTADVDVEHWSSSRTSRSASRRCSVTSTSGRRTARIPNSSSSSSMPRNTVV
jgi:organic hydroperoxide reductase OsmC/OhrA